MTWSILVLSSSARPSARVSSPGSANTWRTPSFSRHCTTSCATVSTAGLFGVGSRGRCLGRAHPDRLDVHEFADAEARELAAVPALLDPAERQSGGGSGHAVDEDCPRLDLAREGLGHGLVARPERP